MFSSTSVNCVIAATLLVVVQRTSAFVPVTAGPSLDAKQGKIAGIGGIDGPKPLTIGGIGAAKISTKAKAVAPKKKAVAKKAAGKKTTDTKKKADFTIKMPWSK
mmetsp:Transcript_4719/g.11890  ORF Transcript_4719/g.11890 Transcript_4719/m.11890 type:complete len:104 (-) Transcript_4719:299-610(-)